MLSFIFDHVIKGQCLVYIPITWPSWWRDLLGYRGTLLVGPSTSYHECILGCAILGGVFGAGWRNPVKLDRTGKVWYLLLRVFWVLLPEFNFWGGDWALGYVCTQIWDFPNISLFSKILSLKSFGNSWGSSYTKFSILDITFRFTCG